MDLYDELYYTLIGELSGRVGGVENAFAPGSECDRLYTQIIEARNRVLQKLGTDTDPDLEQMLTRMSTLQHLLCRKAMLLGRP